VDYLGDQTKKIELGKAYGTTCERREKTWFLWPNLRERNQLEDSGVCDGRIILKWIFKKENGRVDWIELAQDRGRLWALCE
jgi:hypothetical protein